MPNISNKPLLLFIHGLGGDGVSTWGQFPHLLRADEDLGSKLDIAFYRYPTSVIRWPFQRKSVRIQDLAISVRTEVEVRYKSYSDIILVCHSMGGLIAQKYIVDELKDKRNLKIRGIVFYAVPHTGRRPSAMGFTHFLEALASKATQKRLRFTPGNSRRLAPFSMSVRYSHLLNFGRAGYNRSE
jgi:pimeloyl-ACP methyl ester carboxylesterase